MIGPPLIGWLASTLSLPVALALLPILTAAMAAAIVASRAVDRTGPARPT
jgi:hypothetical protein